MAIPARLVELLYSYKRQRLFITVDDVIQQFYDLKDDIRSGADAEASINHTLEQLQRMKDEHR